MKYFYLIILLTTHSLSLFSNNDKKITRALLHAVTSHDYEEVERLLDAGVNVNSRDHDNVTALMTAAIARSVYMTIKLLERGADPNLQTEDGRTALHLAAIRWIPEVISVLITHKASTELRYGSYGYTPLLYALSEKRCAEAKLLLRHGASVNTTDNEGYTPLIMVVRGCYDNDVDFKKNAVALLLRAQGIDLHKIIVEGPNKLEMNALQIARYNGKFGGMSYKEIGRMLLAHLRLYSSEGRVSKRGSLPMLPLDVVRYMATLIDYRDAAKVFKL